MEFAKLQISGIYAIAEYRKPIPAGIIGAKISFEFTDSKWDNLQKTVVFMGYGTKDVFLDGSTATIPAEVVSRPGVRLLVGVYGTDTDNTIAIPTLWADLGTVRNAADPSGDEAADPCLPIWAILRAELDQLKNSGATDEQIAAAVAAYLEENPVGTGTVRTVNDTEPDENGNVSINIPTDYVKTVNGTAPDENGNVVVSGGNVDLTEQVNRAETAATNAEAAATRAEEAATRAEEAVANMGNVDLTGVVKSVNGQTPDENGNVEITVSGGTTVATVEPAEDDIPKVFITGVKPTTKDDVLAEMEYVSKTDRFHAYLEIKCQGSSSMNYAKKNFTVKLYSDESRETKLKKVFKDWNNESNKFVLKANWIDHSHARNIVSARLWGEVVASRPDYDSLPIEMRNAPNNGAVDGFPVKIYYNGTYEGVYTWNIGKDAWMWNMDENNLNHILLCAETNTNGTYRETPCNFRELWNGVHGSNWSVEVGTNNTTVKNSLNNLIQFVMDNDGDAFRNGIGNYLDIQSAIDYYIFMYDICGLDGLARNMLLATYDGTKWICGAYDLDSTLGIDTQGNSPVSASFECPEQYQEQFSLLWERIEANYVQELKTRLAELRKTVLSYSNMVAHFERFMDVIGKELYDEDLTIYTGIPSGSTNNIKQIRNYIRDRHTYVDAEFAAMTVPVPCTGISLNTNTLTFTTEGSQTLTATVTPDGCTDAITWESDNTSVATVDGGVVTAVANGNATITARCGNYSATCSVAVSGVVESIPCTGITFDKTELTFNGEGTQTITATVIPSDTTDSVVWVSSAPSVASIAVDGNVCTVQSVSNGSATITAQCGNYSASCSVTISGINAIVPQPIAYLNSSSLTAESTVWEDASGNGIDFTLSDGTPNVDDNGLLMTSCKAVGKTPISLEGAFSYDMEIYIVNINSQPVFISFNQNNSTKYCDSLTYVGYYNINGYSSDRTTDILCEGNVLTRLTIVRDVEGDTKVYKNGELQGSYARGTFAANGSYDLVLGAASYGGYPNGNAHFRLKTLRIYNYALTEAEI